MPQKIIRRRQVKKEAEVDAHDLLEESYGIELVVGAHIERFLVSKVNLVYQHVEDNAYFGVGVHYKNGE